ncbi:hypothetical protein N7486_007263 [Penicillium sp. IBT 16267x]|nr:hypothetical protein N7486_007263 [Penicillium sp. IBT 16267x]
MTDPTSSTTQPQDPTLNLNPDTDPALSADQRQKEALAAFTATLHSVGTNLEAPLRERATIINTNAISLERQEAELAGHSAALAKQNDGWEKVADETRAGLKEIGDVQNWAEMIERDFDLDSTGEDGDINGSVGELEGEMNGNGNGNGNGVEDAKKEKRRRWFSWW